MWEWIKIAFEKWVLRRNLCWPICKLCLISEIAEKHYDSCQECQSPNFPCSAMKSIQDIEQEELAKE